MLIDDLSCNVAHVLIADAAIVRALRTGITFGRETERASVLVEEILLLETDQEIGIVLDVMVAAHAVGGVRRPIRVHHFSSATMLGVACGPASG